MSDYGADDNPDLNIARDMVHGKNFIPLDKTNVMQWTLDGGQMVQKYAKRQNASNILFKLQSPPIGPGDPCGICWGPGKTFGDVITPGQILFNISGLTKNGDWNPALGEPIDGDFLLDQNPLAACTFSAVHGNYEISIIFFPGLVASVVQYDGGPFQWLVGTFVVCATVLIGGAQFGFDNGLVRLTIPVIE